MLEKHITSQLKDLNLVRPYIDLKKHQLSQVITSKKTLEKEWKKNSEVISDWVSKLMSTDNYYIIDCNKPEERLSEQNESNTRLKLELETRRAHFEDASNYFKKKSYRVEQLETVIDRLIAVKTKTDIVFSSVEIPIDTSRHFVHILSSSTNKSQLV